MSMHMDFSHRTTTLNDLSICITDDIQTCKNGGLIMVLGLKSVYLWCFP